MENIFNLLQFYPLKRLKKLKKNLASLSPIQIKLRNLFHKALKDNENTVFFAAFIAECQQRDLPISTLRKALFLDAENEIERLMLKVQDFILYNIKSAYQQFTPQLIVVDDLLEIISRLLPNNQKKLAQLGKRCHVLADILELMQQATGRYGAALVNLQASIKRKRAEKRDKRPFILTPEQIHLYETTVAEIRKNYIVNEEIHNQTEKPLTKDQINEIISSAEAIYQDNRQLQRRIQLTQHYLQKQFTILANENKTSLQEIQKLVNTPTPDPTSAICKQPLFIKCMIVSHFKKILDSDERILEKTQHAKHFLREHKQVFETKDKILFMPKFFNSDNSDVLFLKSLDLDFGQEPKINLHINILPTLIK